MLDMLNFSIITYVIIWFVQALIVGGACYWLAGEKGRDKINWAILGFLLGFLAVIILGFSPTKIKGGPQS